MTIARIVPPQPVDGINKTQGTQVWVGDQQLTGVTKIEMTADTNDAWRAVIYCMAQPPAEWLGVAEIVPCDTPTTP